MGGHQMTVSQPYVRLKTLIPPDEGPSQELGPFQIVPILSLFALAHLISALLISMQNTPSPQSPIAQAMEMLIHQVLDSFGKLVLVYVRTLF